MEEVSRTLRGDFGLSPEKIAYRESEIRHHFPEAWVEGYERLIPSMTNHPKDRHVAAAAVHARAATIVPYNTRDFAPPSLTAHGIEAVGPSTFLKNLYAQAPTEITATLDAQAAAIDQPLTFVLSKLRVNVPAFLEYVEKAIQTR
jgi:hypothetical protein